MKFETIQLAQLWAMLKHDFKEYQDFFAKHL